MHLTIFSDFFNDFSDFFNPRVSDCRFRETRPFSTNRELKKKCFTADSTHLIALCHAWEQKMMRNLAKSSKNMLIFASTAISWDLKITMFRVVWDLEIDFPDAISRSPWDLKCNPYRFQPLGVWDSKTAGFTLVPGQLRQPVRQLN